jgi:hypothetical protein
MQSKLKQHLAIATGAVSAAAIPMGAEAAIVYKDNTNAFSVSIAGPAAAEWDIDEDGGNDFRFFTFANRLIFITSNNPRNGRGLVALDDDDGHFNNLAADVAIEPTLSGGYLWHFSPTWYRTIMTSGIVGDYGGLQGGQIGSNFIGFRFLSGANMLYGWAELLISTTGGGTVTVNRWAYNDTPDGSIKVGDTGQVPAPPTLALLAAGAFGIRRWRARRAGV